VEVFPELADTARARLEERGVANVEVVLGDVFQMGSQTADVIAVTGSLPVADPRFEDWLRIGGRLFQIVGASLPMQAWRVERPGESDYRRDRLFETAIPPLLHAPRPPAFSF
jgi:protein-L-isoaspartate(D-aspartate) O-methyltransferase